MLEDVGDGLGLEAHVDGVEHGPAGRDPKMRLGVGGDVGQDRGDHVAGRDANLREPRGEPRASLVVFGVGLAEGAVDQGSVVGKDVCRPAQVRQRRQWYEVRWIAVQPLLMLHPAHMASSLILGAPPGWRQSGRFFRKWQTLSVARDLGACGAIGPLIARVLHKLPNSAVALDSVGLCMRCEWPNRRIGRHRAK